MNELLHLCSAYKLNLMPGVLHFCTRNSIHFFLMSGKWISAGCIHSWRKVTADVI